MFDEFYCVGGVDFFLYGYVWGGVCVLYYGGRCGFVYVFDGD